MKSLTLRCVSTFAVLDLAFNMLVIAAFVRLLGIESSSSAYLSLIACLLAKVLACGLYWVRLLEPYERFARTTPTKRTPEIVIAADHAVQAAPKRFGIFYGLSWSLMYGLSFVVMRWLGSTHVVFSPRAVDAVLLVMIAVWFGSLAFAIPLVSMLTADAGSNCSVFARENGVQLDRPPVSLQLRIGVIALSLGLGPTLWMIALGYMKQVEASHAHTRTQVELAASELARVAGSRAAAGQAADPSQLRAALDRPELRDVSGTLLDREGRVLVTTASVDLDAVARAWLRAASTRADAGVLAPIDSDRALGFRELDDGRVAVAIAIAPAAAAGSFVLSAGVFALLVGVWAPVCAIVLGRAVSGPIERLTRAAREIVEEGKQSQMSTLPVPRHDEVGVLSERFNDLLDLMRDLSTAADAIASGDLRVNIERKGELPDAFRRMLTSLRSMVRQIRETSVDLASAATEIFAASQEQEAAAASQSSAMEEISRTMDSLSDSAAHVSEAVQGVLSNAERTLTNTDEMVRRIGGLSAHAGRIAEILEVIREIADRSDLLALNGSLEASRAGEGGQGFALVAAEMRRLAERVTASVQDVKKLVADIRESGSSTVMATEESKRLAEGTTDAARQITFVTQQQRSGTEQVSQSVKNIADVVAQAVSATSQTRTSAEGLKTQADRLAELVRRFEVTTSEAA